MRFDLHRELNPEQCHAASTIEGPVLIIAGAGSGKTRMLTFRIAHMLETGIDPSHILALTFTNKAAKEMAERIRSLTGMPLKNLLATTFHSFGMRILKQYIHHLGYRNNFTIYDGADRQDLLKQVILSQDLDVEDYDLFELGNLFSDIKTKRSVWNNGASERLKNIYAEYNKHMKAYNAVDFDDLIMMPLRLFEEYPEILEKLRGQYTHVMVDEFQDTSLAQYRMVHFLTEKSRNLCVVGDDDQSIYSWRGANYQNIVMFENDFPERKEIKLERNYRSTGNILEAANQLIVHNAQRKEKKLWTDSGNGSFIYMMHPQDEAIEAVEIARKIRDIHLHRDRKFGDFGVLVRTNHLIPTLENQFMVENIPCQISGGQSFFERKEVKDMVCYLKVLANPDDDISFLRIVNTPRRGIGRMTLEKMRQVSDLKHCSLFSAMSLLAFATDGNLKDAQAKTLQNLVEMVNRYRDRIFHAGNRKHQVLKALAGEIDYKGHLIDQHPDNEKAVQWKMKSIDMLCDMFGRWENDPDNYASSLYDYLNRITVAGRESEDSADDKVHLMTMHASKGLEFPFVFLAGVEDHIIPHARTIEEHPEALDEERRLFYVAITRAREELYISSCENRKRGRETGPSVPSRFLQEIPSQLFAPEEPDKEATKEDVSEMIRKMKARFARIDQSQQG